jgi:hypothetical protein
MKARGRFGSDIYCNLCSKIVPVKNNGFFMDRRMGQWGY